MDHPVDDVGGYRNGRDRRTRGSGPRLPLLEVVEVVCNEDRMTNYLAEWSSQWSKGHGFKSLHCIPTSYMEFFNLDARRVTNNRGSKKLQNIFNFILKN